MSFAATPETWPQTGVPADAREAAEAASARGDDFRSRFCRKYNCRPEAFERQILGRVLYLHMRPLALIMLAINRQRLQPEQVFVRQIARTATITQVLADVDFYNHKYVTNSFLRGTLNLRISGRRVIRMAKELYGL